MRLLGLILGITGLSILIYKIDFLTIVGIYLILWGNNLDIRNHIKNTLYDEILKEFRKNFYQSLKDKKDEK